MIWFLIAALTYPDSDLISFKINQQMKFNTETECTEYVKAGIKLKFPNMNLVDIRCIDIESALMMQEQMRNKNES